MHWFLAVGLASCCCGAVPGVKLPAAAFLDQHDPICERVPERWLDGIPLANGRIGALVWGDGHPLKLTLDKYDAWETREHILGAGDPTYRKIRRAVEAGKGKEVQNALRTERIYPAGQPRPTRLPLARVEVDLGQPITWEQARLELRTGTVRIVGKVGNEQVQVTLAIRDDENLLVLRLEGASAARAQIHVGIDHLQPGARRLLRQWGYPEPETTAAKGQGTFHFQAPTGYSYAVAWQQTAGNSGQRQTICLALLSTEDADDPLAAARELVSRAAASSVSALASHHAWWPDYWKRSYLTIPDARLEALYFIEMYKLGCLSRPGGYPITLQGLWTKDGGMPPWAGDYHLDMNVQQSYWPIYAANRLALGEPLYRTFSRCIPRWRRQCQQFFGFDGIWSGCAIGPRGERVFGYTGVELWPGNAAWLAHNYWLHFLYSQDKQFLRDQALPMLRLSFQTYANLLEPAADGKLHVPLSYSPEYFEGGADCYRRDPNVDLALIRFLAGAILRADQILQVDDPIAGRARDVLARLTGYVQRGGTLEIAADTPLAHSHRHHSHLMAIHPLGLITRDGTAADRRIIARSLYQIRVLGTGQWTGWSFPWMSLIAARAGNGNMAWQMLDTYANWFITPNTFHINGDPRRSGVSLFDYDPMTLEAGFGAAAATMEMLLQSYGGQIRVFPAIPDRWHDAFFAQLRAEGAFLVTAKLADGKVRFVAITAEVGGPCRMANPFAGPAMIVRHAAKTSMLEAKATVVSGKVLRFDTNAGESYLLYPAGAKPDAHAWRPPQFQRTAVERHFFGLKRLPRF